MANESERDSKRIYANYLEVGYNAFEVVLDFGTRWPEEQDAHFHTGIITAPRYVDAFLEVLRKALFDYHQDHPEGLEAEKRPER